MVILLCWYNLSCIDTVYDRSLSPLACTLSLSAYRLRIPAYVSLMAVQIKQFLKKREGHNIAAMSVLSWIPGKSLCKIVKSIYIVFEFCRNVFASWVRNRKVRE